MGFIVSTIVGDIVELGYQYREPSATKGQTPMRAVGKEVWTFKILKAGISQISLAYSRPWEDGEKAGRIFKVTVTVK